MARGSSASRLWARRELHSGRHGKCGLVNVKEIPAIARGCRFGNLLSLRCRQLARDFCGRWSFAKSYIDVYERILRHQLTTLLFLHRCGGQIDGRDVAKVAVFRIHLHNRLRYDNLAALVSPIRHHLPAVRFNRRSLSSHWGKQLAFDGKPTDASRSLSERWVADERQGTIDSFHCRLRRELSGFQVAGGQLNRGLE